MKYMLLFCCTLSITLINAAERNFVVLSIDNQHDKPVAITYQGYIDQPSYVQLKDSTATATIDPNVLRAIFLRTGSFGSVNIPGFKPLHEIHGIKEGTLTIHPMRNNQINITQENTSIAVLEQWKLPRKKEDLSSSDSDSCVQQ